MRIFIQSNIYINSYFLGLTKQTLPARLSGVHGRATIISDDNAGQQEVIM